MLLSAAFRALSQIFSPGLRDVFWKSLGLTVLLLAALVLGLQSLAASFLAIDVAWAPWLDGAVAVLTGFGLVVGAGYLIAPVMGIFAGLFLDDAAAAVEARDYPNDPPGQPMPVARAVSLALRFVFLVVLVNLVALLLLFVPGVNLIAFFVANGYLLGREYFQFIAMRFMSEREAIALRKAHGTTILLGGFLIAGFLAIPLLNLLTPLFATALMVHVFKRLPGSYGG